MPTMFYLKEVFQFIIDGLFPSSATSLKKCSCFSTSSSGNSPEVESPFLIGFVDDSGNGFPIDNVIDLCVKRAFSSVPLYIVSSKGHSR
ncbi:hypothetical protein ACI760_09665 [Capnocytophaga canimorsus]|uniref:hypothetical protein n=1 Tax=Capnocytophaga canimorsus TaxID=28188 RepID=UPI00385ADC6C